MKKHESGCAPRIFDWRVWRNWEGARLEAVDMLNAMLRSSGVKIEIQWDHGNDFTEVSIVRADPDDWIQGLEENQPLPKKCEGNCDPHRGEVREVRVIDDGGIHRHNWGLFNYCDEAIREDLRRGLRVVEISKKKN